MDAAARDILAEIHLIRYGKPIEWGTSTDFFKELVDFRRARQRLNENTVTITAIRGWLAVKNRTAPTRLEAKLFLRDYLRSAMAAGLIKPEANAQFEILERLLDRSDPAT